MKHSSFPAVSFYFLRHGETDWNREGRIMGHQDIPLNQAGIAQAHQAVSYLNYLGIDRIVSSPLCRAKETAVIIGSYLKVSVETCDSLKEAKWGEMEGELKHRHAGSFEKWLNGDTPQHAESCIEFQQRIIRALSTVLIPKKNTLLVAHQGVYWAFMKALGYSNATTSNATPYIFRSPETPAQPWTVEALDQKD